KRLLTGTLFRRINEREYLLFQPKKQPLLSVKSSLLQKKRTAVSPETAAHNEHNEYTKQIHYRDTWSASTYQRELLCNIFG
ncbi:MAG: hypothetical protein J5553_00520, partial [Verrucomicrobia bacterium]|nr:hypothetical protein [Verrucomicrobiota bacterium]